ncbi:MAG: hypothetical protein Q9225_004217 [Loekoesia sp. 1 TL-2023]
MTRIATEQSSKWLDVDPWEAIQKEYQPTALVLDHFEHEINEVQQGIATEDGERKAVKIVLLAGADLIQTMSTPGVWSQEDLNHILGKYGVFIVERTGTDIDDALATLTPWRHNIWVIQQLIQNDVSSTKIRLFLKREMSVRYLVPAPVIKQYIEVHGLYGDDGASSSIHEKSKEVSAEAAAGISRQPRHSIQLTLVDEAKDRTMPASFRANPQAANPSESPYRSAPLAAPLIKVPDRSKSMTQGRNVVHLVLHVRRIDKVLTKPKGQPPLVPSLKSYSNRNRQRSSCMQ